MRIRPVSLAVLAAASLAVLSACGEVRQAPEEEAAEEQQERAAQDQEPEYGYLGTDTTCQRPAEKQPTPSIARIFVENGTIDVVPDTLVQPPGIGLMGWLSPRHSWRVTFTEGSPLPDTTYTGAPGQMVRDEIPDSVPCKYYKYDVEVWGGGLPDTLKLDPGGEVEPWG